MRRSRPYLTAAGAEPPSSRRPAAMPPLHSRPQPSNKPFKQRKNFGKGFCFPENSVKLEDGSSCDLLVLHPATRKQEVAGIRSKFPNKIPVSERPQRGAGTGCSAALSRSEPVLSPAGHHRALRQGEISPPAGQNQVPGAARAHHDAVRHHHQVNSPVGPT